MAWLQLFYQGPPFGPETGNGELWYQGFDGANWHGAQQVPNLGMSYSPSPVVFNNMIYVLHQGEGEDGQLWYTFYDGDVWQPDTQVTGLGMSFSPSAVVYNNNLYVFHPGAGQDGSLWYKVADGTNWSPDMMLLPNVNGFPSISQSPSAVVWNNMLYVFFQNPAPGINTGIGNPGGGQLRYMVFDGTNWSQDTQVPNVGMSFSPSAVVFNDNRWIHVFHEGAYENGQLWYTFYDGNVWQPDTQVPGVFLNHDANRTIGGGNSLNSPSTVVYDNNLYVFYLNRDLVLSYTVADGENWSQETQVPNLESTGTDCGFVGCVVF